MMRRIGRLTLLAGLALPCAAAAQAGTITGRVTDQSTGQPISAAQIFLAGTQRGLITDQQGRFARTGVPAGEHEVRATLIGYAQGSERVRVEAGQSVVVDFALSRSRSSWARCW